MNWKEYFCTEDIESVWVDQKPVIYSELATTYFLTNPPEYYAKAYWENQITKLWDSGKDWQFLWDRTGRPNSENLDKKTLVDCSKIHLNSCLSSSYPFCDLKSTAHIGFCINCHNQIIACDSEEYCARCYRKENV